jgi:chemotaxis protein methyltransferase CheR
MRADPAAAHDAGAEPDGQESANTFLTFDLAGQTLGIPVRSVREILDMQPLCRLPGGAIEAAGVIDVRGSSVPVVDLGRRLGLGGPEDGPENRIVVFEVGGRSRSGRSRRGLRRDARHLPASRQAGGADRARPRIRTGRPGARVRVTRPGKLPLRPAGARPERVTAVADRPLAGTDFAGLAAIARREAGLALDGGKTDFLRSRRAPRLAASGATDYRAYRALLDRDPAERTRFVEALTTHTTSFFREAEQYAWLEAEGLPALLARGAGLGRDLVFWSAACSTGQEGWSALMVAERMRVERRVPLRARLIGTDIARPVLAHAARAVYSAEEVEGIPRALRPHVLLSARNGDGRCRIVPHLRAAATWQQANLTEPRDLDGLEADVIFLRNVLIYFDAPTRARVVEALVRRLRPGGFLLTGHTEAGAARVPGLATMRPSIHRKEG